MESARDFMQQHLQLLQQQQHCCCCCCCNSCCCSSCSSCCCCHWQASRAAAPPVTAARGCSAGGRGWSVPSWWCAARQHCGSRSAARSAGRRATVGGAHPAGRKLFMLAQHLVTESLQRCTKYEHDLATALAYALRRLRAFQSRASPGPTRRLSARVATSRVIA
jgi:hypothetical protein